jgi:hypothetical protein
LLRLALVAPEACEAHGGAEFPGLGLLFARNGKSALEIFFGFRFIWFGRLQRDFACNAIDFSLRSSFSGGFGRADGFANVAPGVVRLATAATH